MTKQSTPPASNAFRRLLRAAPAAAALLTASCFGNLLETVHDNLDPILWVQRMDAPNAAQDKDFGRTTAVSADMIAIGDPDFGTEADVEGSCFVYRNASGEVQQIKQLYASPSNSIDGFFSRALSFNGNYLMAGDSLISGEPHFSIYNRNIPTQDGWERVEDLAGTNGFAASVAILDGFAAASDPGGTAAGTIGRIYIYKYVLEDVESWIPTTTPYFEYGALNNRFGASLSGSGSRLLVGAPGENGIPTITGYALVVQLSNTGVLSSNLITAPGLSSGDGFGTSVGLSEDNAIVGAPNHDGRGAAFLFSKDQGGTDAWGLVQAIDDTAGASSDSFGASVAISGDMAAVGAPRTLVDNTRSGCVYLYVRDGNTWTMVKRILPDEGTNNMMFGASVSLSEGLLVVGAPGYTVSSAPRGCAFVYGLR